MNFGIAFIMGYGPLFHGLVYLNYGEEMDFTNVSGFYGPGAVLAWLLTTVHTILSYLKEKKIDQAGFTAIFAYASVAAIDIILRLSRGEHDPQYDAATTVCIYSTLLAMICLNWTGERHLPLDISPKKRLWMLLFIVSVIPTLISYFVPCFSMIGFAKACPILTIGISYYASPQSKEDSILFSAFVSVINWVLSYFVFVVYSGFWTDYITCSNDYGVLEMRFAFPRTASKLSDLDQAAALGAAILGAVYSSGLWRYAIGVLEKCYSFACRYIREGEGE